MNTYRKPLDEIIAKDILPTLMESIVSDDERDLCSLPIRGGDLRIPILRKSALIHYESSKVITAPLVAIIMNQVDVLQNNTLVKETKSKIVIQNKLALLQKLKTSRKSRQNRREEVASWLALRAATRRI